MTLVVYSNLFFLTTTGVLSRLGFETNNNTEFYYVLDGKCYSGEPDEKSVEKLDLLIVSNFIPVKKLFSLLDQPKDYLLTLHRSQSKKHHVLFSALSEKYPEQRILPLWEPSDAGPAVVCLTSVADSELPYFMGHQAVVQLLSKAEIMGMNILFESLRRLSRKKLSALAAHLLDLNGQGKLPYLWRKAFNQYPLLEDNLKLTLPNMDARTEHAVALFYNGLGHE